MFCTDKILVAGHTGLVGSALVRKLSALGYRNLILWERKDVDFTKPWLVDEAFYRTRPDYVFLAAARVGGILANRDHPADFARVNLQIELNAIDAAYRYGVKKFLFLGSSCIYPKLCPQPMKEEYLLSGALEPTNDCYAIAKIAGILMLNGYRRQHGFNGISVMPTNLYGPEDNFDLDSSHVLPAMIRKFHEATANGVDVELWGTGAPRREFLHVDDLADACIFLMKHYDGPEIVNIGTGVDLSIKELATLIAGVVEFKGQIKWDADKPDGTPRKLLDVSKLTRMGWKAQIKLEDGIKDTYQWFLSHS